jgi:hypothetical protein
MLDDAHSGSGGGRSGGCESLAGKLGFVEMARLILFFDPRIHLLILDLLTHEKMGRFFSLLTKFTRAEKERLPEVMPFFTEDKVKELLLPFTRMHGPISSRVLDWSVTNYAKARKVTILCGTEMLNIHDDYNGYRRHFKRRRFDPFRRRRRIYFLDQGVVCSTTLGQLNFLYWLDTRRILHWIRSNLKSIEADMNEKAARNKAQKLKGGTKRAALSKAPTSTAVIYLTQETVRLS